MLPLLTRSLFNSDLRTSENTSVDIPFRHVILYLCIDTKSSAYMCPRESEVNRCPKRHPKSHNSSKPSQFESAKHCERA